MTLRIEKRAKFRSDFIHQFSWYVEEAGEEVARRFRLALDETVQRISFNPTIGRLRHFQQVRLQGLRSIQVEPPFDRFLVFYRFNEETLEITRLIEGSRNLPRRISEFD